VFSRGHSGETHARRPQVERHIGRKAVVQTGYRVPMAMEASPLRRREIQDLSGRGAAWAVRPLASTEMPMVGHYRARLWP